MLKVVNKPWGVTRQIDPWTHHATVVRGGFCSMHKHRNKFNGFYIVRGCLLIEFEDNHVDLHAGDYLEVSPNVWHRFMALDVGTEIIETYRSVDGSEPNNDDIERKDTGGIHVSKGTVML